MSASTSASDPSRTSAHPFCFDPPVSKWLQLEAITIAYRVRQKFLQRDHRGTREVVAEQAFQQIAFAPRDRPGCQQFLREPPHNRSRRSAPLRGFRVKAVGIAAVGNSLNPVSDVATEGDASILTSQIFESVRIYGAL